MFNIVVSQLKVLRIFHGWVVRTGFRKCHDAV